MCYRVLVSQAIEACVMLDINATVKEPWYIQSNATTRQTVSRGIGPSLTILRMMGSWSGACPHGLNHVECALMTDAKVDPDECLHEGEPIWEAAGTPVCPGCGALAYWMEPEHLYGKSERRPIEECPAGGPHTPIFLTAWDQGVGLPNHSLKSDWFCDECGITLPRLEEDFDGSDFEPAWGY